MYILYDTKYLLIMNRLYIYKGDTNIYFLFFIYLNTYFYLFKL